MRYSHRAERFTYAEDRRAIAQQLRAERERARFARICRQSLTAYPLFLPLADRLRLALTSAKFIEQEIQWLKKYEGGL